MDEQMICGHCGYSWHTNSKLMFVTCPKCMRKTKNINIEETNYR